MTDDTKDAYMHFLSAFFVAFEKYLHYRESDSEVSDEACAHRAVKEAGLNTSMEQCPFVTALLQYVSTKDADPAPRQKIVEDAYQTFLLQAA